MNIGIVGAGAIGSYYAASLQRAGHVVRLLARGHHLTAIREHGLVLRTPGEEVTVRVTAGTDVSVLDGAEYVLVAVKSYTLRDVADTLALCARRGATIVPLLNGVDIAERLASFGVPRTAMLAGLATISVARVGPGVVERRTPFDRVIVGELDGTISARASALADAFVAAGSDARATEHIQLELWRKFVFLVPMSVACGLSRAPLGVVFQTAAGRELVSRAIAEIVAVSRAAGTALSDADASRTLDALRALPAAMKPSFLLDLERGGPNETDVLAGAVSRLGRAHGVETPVHEVATLAFSVAAADETRATRSNIT